MLVHQQYFTDASSLSVTHNAGGGVSVNLVVDGEKRTDLIRSVEADSFDPLNKLNVVFKGSITGRLQILKNIYPSVEHLSSDINTSASLLGIFPTYKGVKYFKNKKTQEVAASGYENGNIVHPSVTIDYTYSSNNRMIISQQVVVRDKDGTVISDRKFSVKQESVDSSTKIIHTYEVEQ